MQDPETQKPGEPWVFRPGEENRQVNPITGSNSVDFGQVLASQIMGGTPVPMRHPDNFHSRLRAAARTGSPARPASVPIW